MKTFYKEKLKVNIFPTRNEMGAAAALDIGNKIVELQKEKDEINIIFAAAPSQNEVLENLIKFEGIDWAKINAFHMDEYIGLSMDAPQRFGNFLKEHIFALVPFKNVYYINGGADDIDEECARYTKLLNDNPVDIVCLGIGENGHIAFNDPPVADFDDTKAIKRVKLDEICRQQQVNDGCFATLSDVPTEALTLTIPSLMNGKHLFCSVPAITKADAVKAMLEDAISTKCPCTILRTHGSATLYCDGDSSSKIND